MNKKFLTNRLEGLIPSVKTLKQIVGVYLGDVISKVVAALSMIILIRILSKEDYGLYTNFLATMYYISGIIGYGMNIYAMRFSAEYISVHKKTPQSIFLINLAVQLLLLVPIGILLILFHSRISFMLFGTEAYSMAIFLGAVASIGYLLIEISGSIFNSLQDFKKYVLLLNARQILIFSAILVLWFLGYHNFTSISVVILLLQMCFGFILIFLLRNWFNPKMFNLTILKELLGPGSLLILYYFLMSSFRYLDVFMLSRYRTTEELAVYGVAFRYYFFCLMILPSVQAVLLPKFSNIKYSDIKGQKKFIIQWLRISFLSIIPVGILSYFAEPLFIFVNGSQYIESAYLFRIFCIGIVLSLMCSPLVIILVSRQKYKFLTVTALFALIFNFVGNYLVVSDYGATGVTVITILTFAIINLITLFVLLFMER
ncbi:MAG: oligosaccharide flippase family protein [Bacteroidetes bacterium]|nr:oligosaccharide flippase family protein [Bacteroidota bacterium]